MKYIEKILKKYTQNGIIYIYIYVCNDIFEKGFF